MTASAYPMMAAEDRDSGEVNWHQQILSSHFRQPAPSNSSMPTMAAPPVF